MSRQANDFIRDIIDADLAAGRHQRVATRFPPEPNGYLHIGHAKSICLNFGIAKDYGGTCNLRYDDTNPTKEDIEYVQSIEHDVRWLGFAPTRVLFSADYFPRMAELAEGLIRAGKAYVCDLTDEQIRDYRGTLSEPGRPSPFRNRSVAENLDLFGRMRAGEFPDGARVLRAKIDMAASNMKMRDPLLYRIRHAHHHRTGDAWCIYPMYDYAHPLEDAFEGITHSICTLEFENNRELYDWVIEHTGVTPRPRQYEFARLALDYTVMSKRKLLTLVEGGHVSGWDDPRMPTIAGMRRRGYSPEAIRAFCDLIGVSKANSTVDIGKLEFCVLDDLNQTAPRAMAVLHPLPVTITNADAIATASWEAPLFPSDVGKPGVRPLTMSREVAIEQSDFAVAPPAGWKRLSPGATVRLRYGYCITCERVETDAAGRVTRVVASVLPETLHGKKPSDGRAVAGVIHWVDKAGATPVTVRLYDRLFAVPKPEEGGDFLQHINTDSLREVDGALVEPYVAAAPSGTRVQFERTGYFILDHANDAASATPPKRAVWNRIIALPAEPVAQKAENKASGKAPAVGLATGAQPHAPAAAPKNPKSATRPKLKSGPEYRAEARARDPELSRIYQHAIDAHKLTAAQADLLTGERAIADLFAAAVAGGADASITAKWMLNELPRALGDRDVADAALRPAALAEFISLVKGNQIAGPVAKELFSMWVERGGSPKQLADAMGATATLDAAALRKAIADVLGGNAARVSEYRAGKTALWGFFVGAAMKATGGRAKPADVEVLLRELLA